jgi:hypothetical protein
MNNNMNCNMNNGMSRNYSMSRNTNCSMNQNKGPNGYGMNRNINTNRNNMSMNTGSAITNGNCDCRRNEGCNRGNEPVDRMEPAMSYVPWQKWENIYNMEEGLQKGTIFEDLDKPYIGRCSNK